MTNPDIEIPYPFQRKLGYRLLEILPGLLTWSILFLPIVLAIWNPLLLAVFVVAYMIAWFIKAFGLNVRVIQGYSVMRRHQKIDWAPLIADLDDPKALIWRADNDSPAWHQRNLSIKASRINDHLKSADIIHGVIVPTYNESKEVLEETIKKILGTNFPLQQVVFILAYEERGGETVVKNAKALVEKYKDKFLYAAAVGHPAIYETGEIKGKGSNANCAGRFLQAWLDKKHIDYERVIITTLDADNRPDPNYFGELTYLYLMTEGRKYTSYQPISMFTNNIWDVPAPMRVLATGNSFWNMIVSMRPHMLRNFSAHAQSMAALVDTDFWSTRTIVEDGHQFWRTYFRFDGKHEVFPIFAPIYQDAVLSNTYKKTLRAQFVQLRRWAWGASDIAYVIRTGFFKKNKVPKMDLFLKTIRLIESHISWSTAPLVMAFAAMVPIYINPHGHQIYLLNQLPLIASYIQRVTMIGILVSLYLGMKLLPPKPARYKKSRNLLMMAQWVLLPITGILYGAFAAIYSQTRLMFGWYLGTFDVTDKVIKK